MLDWLKKQFLEGFNDYVKSMFFIGFVSLQVYGTFWVINNILP